MITRKLAGAVCLALLLGCALVPESTTYHRRFERLKTGEEKAAFAFDLMSRGKITPPANIDNVYAIFGSEVSHTTTNNGICTVEICLSYESTGIAQLPPPWILRLEHAVGSRRIDSCALRAPGVGK